MTRWAIVAGAVLLAGLTPGIATANPLASLHASSVAMPETFTAAGDCVAFQASTPTQSAPGADRITLQAESITQVKNVHAGGLTVVGAETDYTNWTTQPVQLDRVQAATVAARPGYTIDLVADPGWCQAVLAGPSGAAGIAQTSRLETQDHVRWQQPPLAAELGSSLQTHASGTASFRAHGDFALSLWEWDLEATTPTGTTTLTSGIRSQAVAQPEGVRVASTEREEQLFLFVHNGTFTYTAAGREQMTAFLPSATIAGANLFLADVEGAAQTAAGALQTAGSLVVAGPTVALLARDAGRLAVQLSGEPVHAVVNGQTITLAPAGYTWWPWLLLAVAVVAAGWATGRRRLHALRLRQAERAMAALDDVRVVRATTRLLRSRRHRGAAAVLRVIALLRLGRLGEAQELLDRAHEWTDPAKPTFDYLLAHLRAAQGRPVEAAHLLAASLHAAPGMASEAAANPLLRKVMAAQRARSMHVDGGEVA